VFWGNTSPRGCLEAASKQIFTALVLVLILDFSALALAFRVGASIPSLCYTAGYTTQYNTASFIDRLPTVRTRRNRTDGGFRHVVIDELTIHHVQKTMYRIRSVHVRVYIQTHQSGAGQRASIACDARLWDCCTHHSGKKNHKSLYNLFLQLPKPISVPENV